MSNSDPEFEYPVTSESDSKDSDSDLECESDSKESDTEELLVRSDHTESSTNTWRLLDAENPSAPPEGFPFTANPGPTFIIESEADVLEYFRLFIDDNFINLLVTETNRYAQQQPTSSDKVCIPVTKNEMYIFLAVIILQGIVKKPADEMYWSKREIINTPIFPKIMNYRRYLQIKKYLHFVDNEMYNPGNHPNPKLCKIWPVYEYLNNKFSEVYVPERDISIDESLMLYKGRLSWVQYIPSKRSRFGIKFYILCEANSGYVYRCIIYTGKGTIHNSKYNELPVSSQIVLNLLETLLGKGYRVTTDNFYTSPQLADILIENKTDIYGTLKPTRKGLPRDLKTTKLNKGETVSFQKGKIMVLKWKDRKDIHLLSTVHNNAQITYKFGTGRDIRKPKVVIDYNHTMGGVDKLDQHLHDYAIIKKG